MQYMGSKNRFSKELVPIIQSYIDNMDDCKGYLEPFVGGANIIDKINCKNKIGCDIHEYLIELLKHIQNTIDDLPNYILEDTYNKVKNNKENYEIWYQGLIGFCSFGNKFWGGYAKNNKNDTTGERTRSYFTNLIKQAPNLKDIKFTCCDFRNLPKDKINRHVIYCDPPYRDTTKYKTETFPYEEFYKWCKEMSKNNIVLISEYNMPEDGFECIWQKETTTQICSTKNVSDSKNIRVEKLYICK